MSQSFIGFGILSVLFGIATGCTRPQSGTTAGITTTTLSHDFFITHLAPAQAQPFTDNLPKENLDCLENIKQVTCYSAANVGFDPKCSKELATPEMINQFYAIVQSLPPLHKNILCHINRVQIQSMVAPIGYVSAITNDSQQTIGLMVGISQLALAQESKVDLFSWKEQLNFGFSKLDDPKHSVSKDGPTIFISIQKSSNSFLQYVLTHEASHLVDYLNSANQLDCLWPENTSDPKALAKCTNGENSFGAVSWPREYNIAFDGTGRQLPQLAAAYPWLMQMCFYSCGPTISPTNVTEVYKELSRSSFYTAYSTVNEYEDFAEASTMVLTDKNLLKYQVLSANKNILFDVSEALTNSEHRQKQEWITNFYAKPDLKFKF